MLGRAFGSLPAGTFPDRRAGGGGDFGVGVGLPADEGEFPESLSLLDLDFRLVLRPQLLLLLKR